MNVIWNEIWKSLVLILIGMLLLRISGRKSISQMTVPTTIVMISIGTIIVQPIADENILLTFVAASVFIIILMLAEIVQLRWNALEKLIKGAAVIVIENGQVHSKNIKKLRLTVDALEMKLRQLGISRLDDVKTATIESNGQLGYELQDFAKPVTLRQMEYLFDKLQNGTSFSTASTMMEPSSSNLFTEIKTGKKHIDNKDLQ